MYKSIVFVYGDPKAFESPLMWNIFLLKEMYFKLIL